MRMCFATFGLRWTPLVGAAFVSGGASELARGALGCLWADPQVAPLRRRLYGHARSGGSPVPLPPNYWVLGAARGFRM
jgi:hypothetical protein